MIEWLNFLRKIENIWEFILAHSFLGSHIKEKDLTSTYIEEHEQCTYDCRSSNLINKRYIV